MATTPTLSSPPAVTPTTSGPSLVANTAALVRVSYRPGTPDSQPCNWELKDAGTNEAGEELIEGVNTVSGTKFSGTRTEFSAAIRGE